MYRCGDMSKEKSLFLGYPLLAAYPPAWCLGTTLEPEDEYDGSIGPGNRG